jgi:hypothetical protein
MNVPTASSWWVRLSGWIIFGLGVVGAIGDDFSGPLSSPPETSGVVLGNGAITLLGFSVLLIGSCLKNLEERLTTVQNAGGKH